MQIKSTTFVWGAVFMLSLFGLFQQKTIAQVRTNKRMNDTNLLQKGSFGGVS